MLFDRRTVLAGVAVVAARPALALPSSAGRVDVLRKLDPGDPLEPRVRVWCPNGIERFERTIYLLDGQYAFAGDGGGVNFAADERVARLMAAGSIPPTLIVAIDNAGDDRFLQYMPAAIADLAGVRDVVEREIARVGGTSLTSPGFVAYLRTRLTPAIDRRYPTSPDRLHTAIFGASMAGVMAGAILVEAQDRFGLGACMSPNWAIYDSRFIDVPGLSAVWASYFAQLGPPEGRRLWLDHGTRMMDAGMGPHQRAIASSLRRLDWRGGCNLQARVYEAGHAFAETAHQMDEVLAWLLA